MKITSGAGPVEVVERMLENDGERHLVEALMSRFGISASHARNVLAGPDRAMMLAETGSVTSASIRAAVEAEYAREAHLLEKDRQALEADRQARLARAAELEQVERAQAAAEAAREQEALEASRAAVVKVQAEDRDRKVESLVRLLRGERGGYRTLLGAWQHVTGIDHRPTIAEWKESHSTFVAGGRERGYDSSSNRAHESLTTATWGEVFGDSITRVLVEEYATSPGVQAWRRLVSSMRFSVDFRTQRAVRRGGYGIIPLVAQGAPYQALPTPADEEATYTISKRGGTEDLTFEAFANNDPTMAMAIPRSLGRAAANTLNRFVLDTLTANPTIYDGVALFAAGHNNTSTIALSGANLSAARRAMRKQASLSDPTDVIGAIPRFLVVSAELEELGMQLANAYAAPVNGDDDSAGLRQPLDVIPVDYWTSTTAWFLVAHPRTVPTFELGFYDASPDPTVIIASDPNTDKVVVKLRHSYGLTTVDFRGFQRGNV
jgi:hypothetical protein